MKTYYLFILLFAIACSKDTEETSFNGDNAQEQYAEVVLQQRDPNLTTQWSKKKPKVKSFLIEYLPPEKFLGYSYRIGNTIVGDNTNAGFSVIDIDRLKANHPSYIATLPIGNNEVSAYSYANFDRYEKNTEVIKKVNSGFSLNLGLFKFGRKQTLTEKFTTQLVNESTAVFGEVKVEVRGGMHTLNTISTARKRIAADFLHTDFLDALYNTSSTELLDEFGVFVLTGYFTGGRASALYVGKEDKRMSLESNERDMDIQLNASFSWGKDTTNSANANLGFGKKYGNSVTTQNNIKDVYYTIKTTGGSRNLTVNTPYGDLKTFNIDLSSWLGSLNDMKTHTLIGIQDKGLTGISEFLLEENFKQRIQDTHLEYIYNDELLEPFIEIIKVYVRSTGSGEKLYEVAAVLNTRQGDKIILNDGKATQASDADLRANNNINTFIAKSQIIANQKKNFYKCTIKADPNKTLITFFRNPLNFELKGIEEGRMRKFQHPDTNMWFIYDKVSLNAFCYYLDSYIPETYGIDSWFASIPTESITMTSLYQRYKIIGL